MNDIIEPIKKKRGRKPKLIDNSIVNDPPIIKILKKRGRKPKNTLNTSTEQSQQSKELDNINTKTIDIELSKELDLNNDFTNISETITTNNIWLNKYQPKTTDEIIGNNNIIKEIKNYLINFETSSNHALVISGGHGVGKNLIIKLILEELGYQIKKIYSTTLKNKNIVSEIIHTCTKTTNIYTSLNKTINQKYAIIIDDTESITLTSEKDNLLELFKINSQHKYFPLIFISNLQHSKLINNLKKLSLDIIINPLPIQQIKDYIKYILNKESMIITNDDIYTQIIKFCQFDMRRLLYVLQDLYYTYNNKSITIEMFKEYQNLTQKKDMDVGLYFATKNLLDNYKNLNKCLQLYETEKVLLPLTIYENYYKKIFKQTNNTNIILDVMTSITNSISIGDVIETNIYSDQNWFLQNIHGFYTCVNTSYTINNLQPKNPKQNQKQTNLNYELVFSADLNKTSSKNINKKKNIFTLQSKFKNKNINDVLYINKILYELEQNKKNSIIKSIKNTYGLDNKNIQIALKIDKTNEKISKNNL